MILDSYLFQKSTLSKLADKLRGTKEAAGAKLEIFSQCIELTHTRAPDGVNKFDPKKYSSATTGKGMILMSQLDSTKSTNILDF